MLPFRRELPRKVPQPNLLTLYAQQKRTAFNRKKKISLNKWHSKSGLGHVGRRLVTVKNENSFRRFCYFLRLFCRLCRVTFLSVGEFFHGQFLDGLLHNFFQLHFKRSCGHALDTFTAKENFHVIVPSGGQPSPGGHEAASSWRRGIVGADKFSAVRNDFNGTSVNDFFVRRTCIDIQGDINRYREWHIVLAILWFRKLRHGFVQDVTFAIENSCFSPGVSLFPWHTMAMRPVNGTDLGHVGWVRLHLGQRFPNGSRSGTRRVDRQGA